MIPVAFQLYSIQQAPRVVPPWPTLMDELCNPSAEKVAKTLQLSVRTVRRYNRTGEAPMPVLMALFWLTRFGRSAVDAQATNDAQLAVSYVRALCEEIGRLQGDLEHLRQIGEFGSANDAGRLPGQPAGRRPRLPMSPLG